MTLEYLVETYGYWALLAGTFLEGETILIIGGFFAYLGYLNLPLVMVIAFVGSFSGDQVYFIVGRRFGRNLLAKHAKWQRRVDRVHELLEKYHDLIMLGFRFVYGMRTLTPFVIGLSKNIKSSRFVAFNAIGALIWSVVISAGGYIFGHALERILKDVKRYQIEIIIAMSIIAAALVLIHRYINRKME